MDRNSLLMPLDEEAQETAVSLLHNLQDQIAELQSHLEYLRRTSMLITSPDAGQSLSLRTENRIIWIQDRSRHLIRSLKFHAQPLARQKEIATLVSGLDDYLDLTANDEEECDHHADTAAQNACTCVISDILKKAD